MVASRLRAESLKGREDNSLDDMDVFTRGKYDGYDIQDYTMQRSIGYRSTTPVDSMRYDNTEYRQTSSMRSKSVQPGNIPQYPLQGMTQGIQDGRQQSRDSTSNMNMVPDMRTDIHDLLKQSSMARSGALMVGQNISTLRRDTGITNTTTAAGAGITSQLGLGEQRGGGEEEEEGDQPIAKSSVFPGMDRNSIVNVTPEKMRDAMTTRYDTLDYDNYQQNDPVAILNVPNKKEGQAK